MKFYRFGNTFIHNASDHDCFIIYEGTRIFSEINIHIDSKFIIQETKSDAKIIKQLYKIL